MTAKNRIVKTYFDSDRFSGMRARRDFGESVAHTQDDSPSDPPKALFAQELADTFLNDPEQPPEIAEPEAAPEPSGPPEDGRLVILIAEDGTEVPARFKTSRRFAHGKWWPNNRWVDNTNGLDMPFQFAAWREWPY